MLVVFLGRLAEAKDPLLSIRALQLARGVEPGASSSCWAMGHCAERSKRLPVNRRLVVQSSST
jgi:hypothetical protein